MLIASFEKTELRCSLPVLLTLPAAVLFDRADTFLIVFFSLALHELAHSFMAKRLGYAVTALEIQPFGFIARLDSPPASPQEAIAVYGSGPVLSLLIALAAAGLMQLNRTNSPLLVQFSSFNLVLGMMNLIPVLPLDGGRLLVSFFSKSRAALKAEKLFSVFGIFFGIILIVSGTVLFLRGNKNFTFISAGFFISIAAAHETKIRRFKSTKTKLKQLSRLRHGESSLRVYTSAISSQCTVREAHSMLSGGGYNMILLIGADGKICGMLDESDISEALSSGAADKRLSDIYAK